MIKCFLSVILVVPTLQKFSIFTLGTIFNLKYKVLKYKDFIFAAL
jgi:hypothetical protein